jgi:hypothetical protein
MRETFTVLWSYAPGSDFKPGEELRLRHLQDLQVESRRKLYMSVDLSRQAAMKTWFYKLLLVIKAMDLNKTSLKRCITENTIP